MTVKIAVVDAPFNTQYAPLAVLATHYQQQRTFQAFLELGLPGKRRDFSPEDKLLQVMLSMLAGCATLSEVNPQLKSEGALAHSWGWTRIADQSTLSRTLDNLTLKQIALLRDSTTAIWWNHSQIQPHDWRSYLWLEYDLSGLPCSAAAEASAKGYFSDKKTSPDASWRG